jgi:DNA-binding NtrC family response regulator
MAEDTFQTQRLDRGGSSVLTVRYATLRVEVLEGPDQGASVSGPGAPLTVGLGPGNDLALTDPTVSRRHAQLEVVEEGLRLRDLDSTNGTTVRGLKVREVILEDGARFMAGGTRLEVHRGTQESEVEIPREFRLGELRGGCEAMQELYAMIEAVASLPLSVLIQGETGTGKELVARTLHERSCRTGPLVVFDAGSVSPELIQSDLFGHVKGAFTGAQGARAGAFRGAEGGTLFLDEIGELPLELQPRLLRALESREVTPVGGDRPVSVDVRVVAATHRDLPAMVRAGEFRADLYHRLATVTVDVPPLRQRVDDLPQLVRHFAKASGAPAHFSEVAMEAMRSYPWPGNLRQLRNVVERCAALCRGREVGPEDLRLPTPEVGSSPGLEGGVPLKEMERRYILDALERHDGHQPSTAKELGISLATLKRRLKEYRELGSI